MVQVPKDRVREAFVAAAAEAFAELGYAATSMAKVAERAGSSVGNLYKYFPNKEALLAAAVPPELVAELERLTQRRMLALGNAKDIRELGADARYHALAGELLDYCIQRRAAVVVVLSRAEGTPYQSFAGRFVDQLVNWSLEYARGPYPELVVTPELGWVLREAYERFVASVARALREFPEEARVRAVIALVTAHHQGGLKRLFESGGIADAQSRNASSPPLTEPPLVTGARDSEPGGAGPRPARSSAGKAHRRGGAGRRR